MLIILYDIRGVDMTQYTFCFVRTYMQISYLYNTDNYYFEPANTVEMSVIINYYTPIRPTPSRSISINYYQRNFRKIEIICRVIQLVRKYSAPSSFPVERSSIISFCEFFHEKLYEKQRRVLVQQPGFFTFGRSVYFT